MERRSFVLAVLVALLGWLVPSLRAACPALQKPANQKSRMRTHGGWGNRRGQSLHKVFINDHAPDSAIALIVFDGDHVPVEALEPGDWFVAPASYSKQCYGPNHLRWTDLCAAG